MRFLRLILIVTIAGLALPGFAIPPIPSPVINPKTLQKNIKAKTSLQKPVFEVKSRFNADPVSPAIMADLCKREQLECIVTLLGNEHLNGPEADIFPIEWVYQCAEQGMPACSRHRWRNLKKVVPSPPAPPLPVLIGQVEYVVECEDETGMCSLKYHTDFGGFDPWGVWQVQEDCELSATDPIPGDGNDPPPPLCHLIHRERFSVAVEGELVTMEFAGTSRGCLVPRAQGALPLAHRNFDGNRDRDYVEVIADRVMPSQNCQGSYRITLRDGRRCDFPCYYEVNNILFDGNLSDNDSLACLIGLRQPVCR